PIAACANTRAHSDHALHSCGVTPRRGPHQCRRRALPCLCVDLGSRHQQTPDCHHLARACRRHDCGLTARQCRVRICPSLEQHCDHPCAAVRARQRQRRYPIPICSLHVGASPKQQLGGFDIVPIRGPVQGSCSIHLGFIHVFVTAKEPANRCCVLAFYRISQGSVTDAANRGRSDRKETDNQHKTALTE